MLVVAFLYNSDANSNIQHKTLARPAKSPKMFSPMEDPKQKELRIFNELMAKCRMVNNNFALKSAIEQIDQMGGIEKMDGYPEAFKCPLSLELMQDPLMDKNGHSFDRALTIGLVKSPMTQEPYPPGHQFKPNNELKELMLQFYKVKGMRRKTLAID